MFVTSIGYRTLPIPGFPFDAEKHIIPSEHGRVSESVFTCGWAKRGPTGIIDATLRDTVDTVKCIQFCLDNGELKSKESSIEDVMKVINKKDVMDYEKWKMVDLFEK